ncbi:MAG: dihydrolipoamide acetyltransferase family protein [Armatimonadota bacterium]|nr:dihydrolipoamide acetyltransferase family protein [Armatimonadota bacterium]
MAIKMLMPLLGQTMEEGTIIRWFKKEGDEVKAGEPLLEVMTDKVNMEVEAPESGILRKILAQPDEVVPVKEPIAIIGAPDEPIDHLLGPSEPAKSGEPQTESTTPVSSEQREPVVVSEKAPVDVGGSARAAIEGRVFASPAARRAAREHGIDISLLAGRGTGPGGRITEKDVLDYVASTRATPLAEKIAADLGVDVRSIEGTGVGKRITSEDVQRAASTAAVSFGQTVPFSGLRKAVAQAVASSAHSAVQVTLVVEVDMTECVHMREAILQDAESRYGVRISYTDIITKAVAKAIQDKPIVNSTLREDTIVIHEQINIGIATAVENGLVVPVIKDVPNKSLVQISREIKELVSKAREGKLDPQDLSGGTFTITNLGAYGIDSFNPVITPGQSAILGVCRIVPKPVVVDGQVQVRQMMNLCLTFDHRVMDGAPAAEFLSVLKRVLEQPYLIFI